MFIVVTCDGGGGGGGDYDGKRSTERRIGSCLLIVTATTTSMGAARWVSLAPCDGMVARLDVGSWLLLTRCYVDNNGGYACCLSLACRRQ
jgi:hypothetical protein